MVKVLVLCLVKDLTNKPYKNVMPPKVPTINHSMYDVKLSLLIHCDLLQELLDLSTSVLLGFDEQTFETQRETQCVSV